MPPSRGRLKTTFFAIHAIARGLPSSGRKRSAPYLKLTRLHPQGKGGPKDTLCRISSDSVQPLDQFVHESYSWVRQILFRIDQIWSKKFEFGASFWSVCTRILFLSPPKTGSQTVQMKHSKLSFWEPGGRNRVKCLTPRLWARRTTDRTDRQTNILFLRLTTQWALRAIIEGNPGLELYS